MKKMESKLTFTPEHHELVESSHGPVWREKINPLCSFGYGNTRLPIQNKIYEEMQHIAKEGGTIVCLDGVTIKKNEAGIVSVFGLTDSEGVPFNLSSIE